MSTMPTTFILIFAPWSIIVALLVVISSLKISLRKANNRHEEIIDELVALRKANHTLRQERSQDQSRRQALTRAVQKKGNWRTKL